MINKELIQKLRETADKAVAQRTLYMALYRIINDLTEGQAARQLGVHKNTIAQATLRVKKQYGVTTNAALLLELLADKKITRERGVWAYVAETV
jgi:hypothetical protein